VVVRAVLHIDLGLRRVWIFRRRWHHGKLGVLLIAAGTWLCVHDRSDWRDWFRREWL
jgi:hypothetical protein